MVGGVWTRKGGVQGVTFLNTGVYRPLLLLPANYLQFVNLEDYIRVDGEPESVKSKQTLLLLLFRKQPQLG